MINVHSASIILFFFWMENFTKHFLVIHITRYMDNIWPKMKKKKIKLLLQKLFLLLYFIKITNVYTRSKGIYLILKSEV